MNTIDPTSTSTRVTRWAALLLAVLLVLAPHSPGAMAAGPSQPDLTLSGLKLKAAGPGLSTQADVQVTVKNQGKADARGITVSFAVGENQATAQIDKLKAGKSKDVTVTIATPPTRGTGTVVVQVDPGNTVAESNETNNVLVAPLTARVDTLPDLVIDKVSLEQTTVTPPEVKVTLRVKNQGKGDAPAFKVRAWQPANSAYDQSYDLDGLKAGQAKEFGFTRPPAAHDPATYRFEVDPDDLVQEANEANNQGSGQIKIKFDAGLPNLVIDNVHATRQQNGARLQISYVVRNLGGSDIRGPVEVTCLQQWNQHQNTATIPGGLRKGEAVSQQVAFDLPPNPPDAYGPTVRITADPQHKWPEAFPANNIVIVTIRDPNQEKLNPFMNPDAPLQAQP